MSKVDWSLAPEGATHKDFTPHGLWYRFNTETDIVCYWNNKVWQKSGTTEQYNDGSMDHMEARPVKPWSGPEDGLPPVGVECEVDHGNGKHWDKVTILAHHGEKAIYLDPIRGIHYIWGLLKDFRTIRTPEQRAAEKRETAIRELMDIAQVDCRVTAARLVDAGFKREVV